MRLWHEALLDKLPRQQLLGQHREICGMRGQGWGQNHGTVNYVWKYGKNYLTAFHIKVLNEMIDRGYNPDEKWYQYAYQGKNKAKREISRDDKVLIAKLLESGDNIYEEHDKEYLKECLKNLLNKEVVCRYINNSL